MGSSSKRCLELKLMGCKGLQAFNFFQKLKVFALVSLASDNNPSNKKQQQRTKTDAEGDKDPEWNHEMRFDLDREEGEEEEGYDHLYLHIDLRHEFFGGKSLGEVRVPLTDLGFDCAGGDGNGGVARFVSYEVRTHENKPNGVITFSYKLLNPHHGGVGGSATATATTTTATGSKENSYYGGGGRIDGFTVVNHVDDDHHHHSSQDQNQDSIPTSCFPSITAVADGDGYNDLLHQQQQQHQNQHHHHHQSDHDQNLQIPYNGRSDQEFSYYYSTMESTTHPIQYPPLEPPSPPGEGYMSYPRLGHHQYLYPPPPIHSPQELTRVPSHPFPPPPPPPFHPPPELNRMSLHPFPPPPPPPELTRISSDPFPPPHPPLHHHHHHPHGAVYPPPSPGDGYEHSYSMSRSIYYNGDGTRRY